MKFMTLIHESYFLSIYIYIYIKVVFLIIYYLQCFSNDTVNAILIITFIHNVSYRHCGYCAVYKMKC